MILPDLKLIFDSFNMPIHIASMQRQKLEPGKHYQNTLLAFQQRY